jgi:hypothetical protein
MAADHRLVSHPAQAHLKNLEPTTNAASSRSVGSKAVYQANSLAWPGDEGWPYGDLAAHVPSWHLYLHGNQIISATLAMNADQPRPSRKYQST